MWEEEEEEKEDERGRGSPLVLSLCRISLNWEFAPKESELRKVREMRGGTIPRYKPLDT